MCYKAFLHFMSKPTPNHLWKNSIPGCGVEYPLLSHLGFTMNRKSSHSHWDGKLLSDSLVAAGLFSVLHLSCLWSCKSHVFTGPMNIGRGSLVDQLTVPGLRHWEHPLVQKYDCAVWISSLLLFSWNYLMSRYFCSEMRHTCANC